LYFSIDGAFAVLLAASIFTHLKDIRAQFPINPPSPSSVGGEPTVIKLVQILARNKIPTFFHQYVAKMAYFQARFIMLSAFWAGREEIEL
jgi:hypothetical protein